METMANVMAKVRSMDITEVAGEEVLYVADYLSGVIKYANGSIGYTGLPESNVIYLGLEDEQFICIRPSGTEPQLKIYVLVYENTKEKSQAKADKLMDAVKEMLK